jgi:hypothetical protein
MQVMTLIIEMTVKLPLSSRRRPGSSGFRRAPARFGNEKHGDSWRRSTIKKPARRPVEEEIKQAENKKHYQKANW